MVKSRDIMDRFVDNAEKSDRNFIVDYFVNEMK